MSNAGTWLIDLDGVVWLSGEEIKGSAAALDRLRNAGESLLFVTNNSAPTVEQLLERLAGVGITATRDEVLTAAQAAASLIEPRGTAVCLADGGVREALEERSITVTTDPDADAVIVGWTQALSYDTIATAATAVRGGARFIGTNPDATHPTPRGLMPGTGAIIAAVEVASGRSAEYAGKPNQPMAKMVLDRATKISMVVGDQAVTDGAFAQLLDVPFTLVLSGVDRVAGPFTASADRLEIVVDRWLEAR